MSNIYNDPHDFGLEIFEHISDDRASYDFDDFCVFRRKEDGKLFWAKDSGCSCPCPFEDVKVDDLTPIVDLGQFDLDLEAYRVPYGEHFARCSTARKQEVVRKIKEYLEAPNV